MEIGENTYLSHEININCKKNIKIGKNCLIGYQTIIMDFDGHMIYEESSEKPPYKTGGKIKPIVIGDNVWIGFRCSILKGVHIGDNSIIAAGSVVTRDIDPNTIVAGNPAKVVKKNIYWER
ncbi:MAG: acyltransferase [Legionellales bacterium]|nr:acyltransferase [Legionellales bacterium]